VGNAINNPTFRSAMQMLRRCHNANCLSSGTSVSGSGFSCDAARSSPTSNGKTVDTFGTETGSTTVP